MKNLFDQINKEIKIAESKFINLNPSNIHEKAQRLNLFGEEYIRLTETLNTIIDDFLKSNNLTDIHVKEIVEFTEKSVNDFIVKTGIIGLNRNYKLKIRSN